MAKCRVCKKTLEKMPRRNKLFCSADCTEKWQKDNKRPEYGEEEVQ